MNRAVAIMAGAMTIVLFAFVVLVMTPTIDVADNAPPPGLQPYTEAQIKGRELYQSMGCVYCHSQQVRDNIWSKDEARGWGRPSVSSDYYYDNPHFLGTMRTGPDLANIGARQPSDVWHHMHLLQPRSVVPSSIMPAYPFLYKQVDSPEPDDIVVNLPPQFKSSNKKWVATEDAKNLVAYLKSLNRTHPVSPRQ